LLRVRAGRDRLRPPTGRPSHRSPWDEPSRLLQGSEEALQTADDRGLQPARPTTGARVRVAMNLYLDDDSADSLLVKLLGRAGHDVLIPADLGAVGKKTRPISWRRSGAVVSC